VRNIVVKKFTGDRALERGLNGMAKQGYVVDQQASRKALYSAATGVFTRKQIHTVTFRKQEHSQQGKAERERLNAEIGASSALADMSFEERQAVVQARYDAKQAALVAPVDAAAVAASEADEGGEPEAISSVNVIEQIKALAELRDQGIVSSDEFDAKKAELLARL
jgi:hypothetical protein